MDFMNLAEVPEVDSVQDGDTVFVVRDGEVCRVAKDKVGGGAGGYLLEVADDEIEVVDTMGNFCITTPCDGAFEAIKNGGHVTIVFNTEAIGADVAYAVYIGICVTRFMDSSLTGLSREIAYAFSSTGGEAWTFILSNGQEIPDTASATSLLAQLRGGTNAVV